MALPEIPKKLSKYLISTKEASQMCKDYKENQYCDLKTDVKAETLSVWYPIEVIEQYICYLKRIENSKGESVVDGIRFYFGAYPDRDENKKTGTYGRRQTIIALPTKANKSKSKYEAKRHDDIYLDSKSHRVKKIDPHKAKFKGKNQNTALNMGHATPPPPWG